MKTTKGFILGLIVGFSVLFTSVYASVSGAGTLGNLFEKVGSNYKLLGDNIKDDTIDSSELEENSVGNSELKNDEKINIKELEINNGDNAFKMGQIHIHHNNEINNLNRNLYLQYRGGKNTILNYGGGNVGIGTSSPSAKLEIANGNNAFKMGDIHIHNTNEINNPDGTLYLQYRGNGATNINHNGKNAYFGGDIYSRGHIIKKTIFWTRTIDGNDIDSYHYDTKTDSKSCPSGYHLLSYGVKDIYAGYDDDGWEGGHVVADVSGQKVTCDVYGTSREGYMAGACFITCYK